MVTRESGDCFETANTWLWRALIAPRLRALPAVATTTVRAPEAGDRIGVCASEAARLLGEHGGDVCIAGVARMVQ